MAIADAISLVQDFKADSLAETVAELESTLAGVGASSLSPVNHAFGVNRDLLKSAAAVKQASAQIDVIVHAVGILWTLPHILDQNEVIESTSLGAGSANSGFDLVTSHRIAEFKFIHWKGGAESVRKQTLFQDFYRLAREATQKQKELYLLNTEIPLRFLTGRSSAAGVLRRRNAALAEEYASRYGTRYGTVGEFYKAYEAEVRLVNLIEVDPAFGAFVGLATDEPEVS